MRYDSVKLTELCIKYNITPTQFHILYLLYKKDWKSIENYLENKDKFDLKEIDDLIKKGYLIDLRSLGQYQTFDLIVTPKFTDTIWIDTEDAGEELFAVYPNWLIINNQRIIAKSCDKDLYIRKYALKIGNNMVEHEAIIKDVERAKEEGLINFKISNFIDGELWNSLRDTESPTSMIENI